MPWKFGPSSFQLSTVSPSNNFVGSTRLRKMSTTLQLFPFPAHEQSFQAVSRGDLRER